MIGKKDGLKLMKNSEKIEKLNLFLAYKIAMIDQIILLEDLVKLRDRLLKDLAEIDSMIETL